MGNLSNSELEKAFGGCKICYGKGYSTATVATSSRYGTKIRNTIVYCKCDRGKQLDQVTQIIKGVKS